MRRFVILALVLTLKVASSSQNTNDGSSYGCGAENKELQSSTPEDDSLKQKCEALRQQARPNVLQKVIGWFGPTGDLASTYVATRGQKQAVLNYTELCSDPKYGPIDKTILLVKWNINRTFIYPGTKWCGAGNVSTESERYGPDETTDKCCETHDKATDYILASRTHVNHTSLKNPRRHTVTNCKDDIELFDCLYKDNTSASLQFGQAFFDALRVPCFINTFPKVCKRKTHTWWSQRCDEYYLDTTKDKIWQFFYPPSFFNAFVRKWYPGYITQNATEFPDTWKLLCPNETTVNCSRYEFMGTK